MGKVVILGGNARSGKSTLAHMLATKNYTIISFDILQDVIETNFNISFNDMDEDKKFNFFQSIVNKYVEESELNDMNIVIDMYDFLPKDVARLDNLNKVEVYFLGYPNQSREEIKYNIIHYAKPTDWIAQVNEEYLNQCVERFFIRNQMLVEECKKYNQTLIDTKAKEERPLVLEELFNTITENNNLNNNL